MGHCKVGDITVTEGFLRIYISTSGTIAQALTVDLENMSVFVAEATSTYPSGSEKLLLTMQQLATILTKE